MRGLAVHWETVKWFKRLIVVFFRTMTPNIALNFPANTELIGCLEGRELKKVCSSKQWIQYLD